MNKLFLLICLCILYSLLEANVVNTFKHTSDNKQEERNTNVGKLALVFPDDNDKNDSCALPDGKIGTCINIKNCLYALNLLKKQKQPKICRFDGHEPIVCCASTTPRLGKIINSINQLEYCTLADGQKGTCVNIRHCRYAQDRATLRKRIQVCYLEGEDIIVCCLKQSGDISLKKCDYYYPPEPPGPPKYAIMLGIPSLVKEFPFMAVIGFGNESNIQWACGGTLISEKFILTAAHCLNSQHLGPAKFVRLGDLDLSIDTDDAEPQNYTIKRRIPHPDYKSPLKYHDIALLELGTPVKRTGYVDIACLNTNRFYPHHDLEAMGWGKIEYAGDSSSILLKAFLNVVPRDECQTSYRKDTSTILPNGIVDDLMICAIGESDTCQGDSGGPLVSFNANKSITDVVGITAFGRPCGNGKSPGVYTRVFPYLEWIENTVWPN